MVRSTQHRSYKLEKWHKIVALLVLLFSDPSLGDAQSNLRNTLPGGRAAMLGGAYTAISNDPSGAYYNPAGLANMSEKSLDISATAYRKLSTVYENAINQESLNQKSDGFFPNFLGGANKWGNLALGYAFITLDQRNIYQQNKFDDISELEGAATSYEETRQESTSYILAGPAIAWKWNNLSIGGSFFYYQRKIDATTLQLSQYNGGRLWSITHTYQTLNTGVMPVLGLKYEWNDLHFGASVRIPRAINNRTDLITEQIQYDPLDEQNATPAFTRDVLSLEVLNEVNPVTYRTGVAWIPNEHFLVSGDFLMHEGKKNPHVEGTKYDFLTTYNYSVGTEVTTPYMSFRAGWFTNHSLYRQLRTYSINQPTHLNYTGISGGIGWNFGSFRGDFGYVQQKGTGQSQVITNSQNIQDVTATNTMYLLSGNIPIN